MPADTLTIYHNPSCSKSRETVFREKYDGKVMDDAQWIMAVVADPILMQRPNVVRGNVAVIGRPLEHGFLRVRCERCHAEKLVAFSCKRRAFCPSCGGRRMAETSTPRNHLTRCRKGRLGNGEILPVI